jgi:N-acetylmuramoyl-L-alanine amidase
MSAAAHHLAAGALCALMAFGALAVEAPPRVTPTRPAGPAFNLGSLPVTRFGGLDYVSATDLASRLGLKAAWTEPGKKLLLTDATNRALLEADERDAPVNGVRLFFGWPVRARGGQLYVSRVDAERVFAPLVRPGLGVALPPAPRTIVLDPGHGGRDDGTENRALGLKEKVLTLDVALRLKKLLEAAGFRVVLTRATDESLADKKDVDLALRADLANRAGADLFVSIHFNAAAKDTRGTEVFWFAPRTLRSADSWGPGYNDAFTDDAPANRFDHWNVVLGAALHRELLRTLATEDRGLKMAHWAVLRTLNCPGVLVEPVILSNDSDARRAARPEFRQQIAEALAAGIRSYAAMLAPVRLQPSPAPAVSPVK